MKNLLNTKRLRVPSHVQNFRCKQCGDCCLQKWRIEVDKKTYDKVAEKYKELGREQELSKVLKQDEQNRIAMEFEKGRCAALTQDNLCTFQKELGHEYLSNTCKVYPRHICVSSRGLEFALTFSCRAAAETLLTQDPISIREYAEDTADFQFMKPNRTMFYLPEALAEGDIKKHYFDIEQGFVAIMQDRSLPIKERLVRIGVAIVKLMQLQQSATRQQVHDIMANYRQFEIPNRNNLLVHLQLLWGVLNIRMSQAGSTPLKNAVSTLGKVITLGENGLGLQEASVLAKLGPEQLMVSPARYAAALEQYVQPEAENIAHLLEHYFVNFILKKDFYFSDMITTYFKMTFLYAVMMFFITGYCCMTKKSAEADIVLKAVVELDNGMSHSEAYLGKLRELLSKNSGPDVLKQAIMLANV